MSKTITSEILVAYAQCPRKAFLLLCTKTPGTPHEYIEILAQQRQNNQRKYLDILQKKHPTAQPYNQDALKNGVDFLVNATLEADGLAAGCAILSKVRSHSALGRYSYEPTIFVGTHSINKEQKLELFFVSHVLEQVQGKRPASGRIIGLNEKSHKVKLENSPKILIPFLEPLQEWAVNASPEPPLLILNKHCPTCQFRSLCRAKAEQEDHLSLLDGISTPKALNKYEKKGLFTVKQLSYTFKPRKRNKRAKNPPPITHKPELQALAIREQKIYVQELPELTRQPVELFLDIEGIPDRHFYYLVGLLVCENNSTSYHSFWANTPADEAQMWHQFWAKVGQYPDVPIYHYGSFEPHALAKLAKRYNTEGDSLANRLVNVNKHVYGKVYFPVYSNRLKEIGAFIGATWTAPNASGLQSLVWRHHWDETCSDEYKYLLLTYNEEDCGALKLLTDELSKIKHSANTLSEVDFANQPKRHIAEASKEVHSQFKAVLKFAHSDYDKKKISFSPDRAKQKRIDKRYGPNEPSKLRETRCKAAKVVEVEQRKFCPRCDTPLRPTNRISKKVIVDLVLIKNGVRKAIKVYTGIKGYCPRCTKYFAPPEISKYYSGQSYGHGFKAWFVYHRVALRMPYNNIVEMVEEQFNEKTPEASAPIFIRGFSAYYIETERIIIQRLLESPIIHVDETPINIRGDQQYVWVFTTGHYVAFKLQKTREVKIVHEFLGNYNGILISDFYPGYDSILCRQQKCWVHLIRDLNNDLWSNPFDVEFEEFVLEIRDLIIPIMETIHKYGLKKRHLNKFKKWVNRFYKRVIYGKDYRSELSLKYRGRFIRYRNDLFTFLEHDGVPWHNNTAEIALRHLVVQEKISRSFFESVTHHYLRLLGIRQTCRFQGKSFFKFLFSGETDLDKFEARKRKRRA